MRVDFVVVACLATGCGRVDFDPLRDAGRDSDVPDAPDPVLHCDWLAGPVPLGPPTRHAELSSPQVEVDPFLAQGDPRTMYLTSERDGTLDIFVAHRALPSGPFDEIHKLGDLSTNSGQETALIVASDDLHGYFAPYTGTHPFIEEVARDAPGSPFHSLGPVAELDALGIQVTDPAPSPDGLSIAFTVIANAGSGAAIWSADRPDRSSPWRNFAPLSVNVAGAENGGATLTGDRRVMVWSVSGVGIVDAVRAEPTAPFGAPNTIPGTTGAFNQFEPSIREDGCELFFSRDSGGGDFDIYSLDYAP